MSELNRPASQATVYFWRIVALTAVILFLLTAGAAIQLARKLGDAQSIVHLTRAEQEREREASAGERDRFLKERGRLIETQRVYQDKLSGHSHGRDPHIRYGDDPGVASGLWGRTHRRLSNDACSGTMEVWTAAQREQFRQWMFDGGERSEQIRFRYSVELPDAQGFLLRAPHKILTAEILPVLTNSDEVEFFLWVSSSSRPADPFPRRLIPLGSVPRATAANESFVLVDRLVRTKFLRPGDSFPLFDVVRQSDGATVVSLNGLVENFVDPVEAPRPDA